MLAADRWSSQPSMPSMNWDVILLVPVMMIPIMGMYELFSTRAADRHALFGSVVADSTTGAYNDNITTTQHRRKTMFTILRNGTPIINADDMQTAIRFVQSLESSLDRAVTHSPYTIIKARVA